MRKAFHEELDRVAETLVEMTHLASSAMNRATTALLDADIHLADSVIAADAEIDARRAELDLMSFDLLARQQPVATDLRVIVTSMRMSSDIERMGDLARHVAKVARLRYPASAVPAELRATILQMGQVAERIVEKAGSVIAARDVEAAHQIERDDDAMDDLHRELFARVHRRQLGARHRGRRRHHPARPLLRALRRPRRQRRAPGHLAGHRRVRPGQRGRATRTPRTAPTPCADPAQACSHPGASGVRLDGDPHRRGRLPRVRGRALARPRGRRLRRHPRRRHGPPGHHRGPGRPSTSSWREALDEGRPGAPARRSVLTAAVAAAPPARRAPPPPGCPVAPRHRRPAPDAGATDPWSDPDDDDPVLTALEAVRARGDPARAGPRRRRVGLGAPGPTRSPTCSGCRWPTSATAPPPCGGRLIAAHDAARVGGGPRPADWALDVDLDAVVEHLLAGQGDPPDPAALVEERRRSVRRRSVVAGGAAAVAAGAVGWWVVARRPGRPPSGRLGRGRPPRPGRPRRDDPSWEQRVALGRARSPRHRRRGCRGSSSAARTAAARLLFADDVDGPAASSSRRPSTRAPRTSSCRPGTGEPGSDPATLQEVPFQSPFVAGGQGAVPLALPTSPGHPPARAGPADRHRRAVLTPTVRPTVAGTIGRDWVSMPLTAGIGATRWDGDQGPALRVRVRRVRRAGRRAGPDLGRPERHRRPRRLRRGDHAGSSRPRSAQPVDSVRTEVVTDATVGGSVIDPTAISALGGDGRVRVLRTTTRRRGRHPLGARRRRRPQPDELARPRAAGRAARRHPRATSRSCCGSTTPGPGSGRFLVIAPGAARVQLLSTSPNAYPVSKVTSDPPGRRRDRRGRQRRRRGGLPARAARRRRAPDRRPGCPAPAATCSTCGPASRPCSDDGHRRGGLPRLRRRAVGRARAGGAPGHPRRADRPPGHDRRARRPARRSGASCSTRGSPGAAARRRVLTGALAADPAPPVGTGARRHAARARRPRPRADDADDARRGRPAAGRAAQPPRSSGRRSPPATVWGLDPGRVADLLGMPPATVRDADLAVRGRLLAAHTAARAAAGWEPAEWALDRDLDDALDLLLDDHTDPPDAVALVGERHRQVRRRSVVARHRGRAGRRGRRPPGSSTRS